MATRRNLILDDEDSRQLNDLAREDRRPVGSMVGFLVRQEARKRAAASSDALREHALASREAEREIHGGGG